jgi:hypothetical protein
MTHPKENTQRIEQGESLKSSVCDKVVITVEWVSCESHGKKVTFNTS